MASISPEAKPDSRAMPIAAGCAIAALLALSACGSAAGGAAIGTMNDASDVTYVFQPGADAAGDSAAATPTDAVGDGGAPHEVDSGGEDVAAEADGAAGEDAADAADAAGSDDVGEADGMDGDGGHGGSDDGGQDGEDDGQGGDGAAEDGGGDVQADGAATACGNGKCDGNAGETCLSCAQDCGACPAFCGDGSCGAGEDCKACSQDCGACPASCGNGKCEPALTESCKGCPQDCGACPATCGNGKCDGGAGESCQVCPEDCGGCPPFCGDGKCNGTDTCGLCPLDCGVCPGGCGDGKCDGKETCSSCSADCGQCPGACSPLTSSGCTAEQQCYPVSIGTPLCGKPGTLAKGTTCSGGDDCSKGMLCVGSICKSICDTTGATPGLSCGNGKCNALSWGDGKPIGYNMGSCFEVAACNLVTDSGCPADQACEVLAGDKYCMATGSKAIGQGCPQIDDCVKGTMCIGNPAQCLKKCNTALKNCPAGQNCLQVTIDAKGTIAPDQLGVCN